MTKLNLAPALILALAFGLLARPAEAAIDTQDYTVTVSSTLTITAPAAALITHDGGDANQAFTSQDWTIACNDPLGSTVQFGVSAPFTHTTDASYQADVKLDLALGTVDGAANWTVGTATDTTDHANATPDPAAMVSASSTAAGDATLSLTVTFVQSDFSVLAAGDYAVTVTGTITAN